MSPSRTVRIIGAAGSLRGFFIECIPRRESRATARKWQSVGCEVEWAVMRYSDDYQFTAVRHGPVVVIRGTVLAPPGSDPYLVAAFDPRPHTRAFRLAFRNNNAAVPFEPHDLESFEVPMPADVDTLKIRLPNEDVFVIHSQQH
jgi:hypothetical protein